MERYTQDDVVGLRQLIRNETWKKLVRMVEARIEAWEKRQKDILGDVTLGAETARMYQLKIAGEIQGLRFFTLKPEKMLTQIINEPAPAIVEKKDKP